MSLASVEGVRAPAEPITPLMIAWIGATALALLLFFFPDVAPWAVKYPSSAALPLADWMGAFMGFLKTNFSWLTRFITDVFSYPLNWAFNLFSKGWKLGAAADAWKLPRLSWIGIVGAFAIAGYALGGSRLAAIALGCTLYIAVFGQWDSAMLTLALIAISVPLCIVTGVALGIWAFRKPKIDAWLISPALDFMQTMPTFAYLLPMLLLFGTNPVSAMLSTAIFAIPPMVRATTLALSRVPEQIDDFGTMVGCTRDQKLFRVLLPAGMPTLMIGVNQVIMLALNMVIIASMIGAGGLGYDVLLALRALKIGPGMEAGLAIVALAIVLDRLSQAAAVKRPTKEAVLDGMIWQRYPNVTLALTFVLLTTLIGAFVPEVASLPKSWTISTGPMWKDAVDWITVNFFNAIDAFRTSLLVWVLNPVRGFLEGFPWLAAVVLIGVSAFSLGGRKLALLVVPMTAFLAISGLWEKSMATLYLCGVSSIIAALLGIPIGLWASRSNRVEAFITPILDTLQTLPSFCFIIPVVMLFRVGDVTAMIATILFAIVPAIRYTNHGIRQIPVSLIEAAQVSGCTKFQTFWHVQLPLALPEIMLGLNQTVLLALSMIIICAMIGTRDLGQEVFIALAKADAGRGIIAGIAIAFIGIVSDRMLRGLAARAEARLGVK